MSTKIGKLKYYPTEFLGSDGNTVFKGIFRKSLLGNDKLIVAVKRVQKNAIINLKEVEVMKKIPDHPHLLRLIHTEENKDFL